jgi:hypothetical protein
MQRLRHFSSVAAAEQLRHLIYVSRARCCDAAPPKRKPLGSQYASAAPSPYSVGNKHGRWRR